jgi:hypothetical protein
MPAAVLSPNREEDEGRRNEGDRTWLRDGRERRVQRPCPVGFVVHLAKQYEVGCVVEEIAVQIAFRVRLFGRKT